MVERRATTSAGGDEAAPEVTRKVGARADGEPTGETDAVKAAAAHGAAGAEKEIAPASLAAPVATAAGAAETEAELKGRAGTGSLKDVLLFAIEKKVPRDAAIRLSADLQARAAEAAADDEDEEALECTVMKRGNYWPYFWSQRLLVVERRSLLYFATPLPAGGAAPRGFFPLQPNTRLLLSFDRVSLYGRTEGLLLGIFNAPASAAASAPPSSPGASASSAVAPLFLSPVLWASNQGAHAMYRPLHLPKQQHQRHQRREVATSGEHRKGDVSSLGPPQCATPHAAAGPPSVYARPVPPTSRNIPLSLLLVPVRSLFAWFSSSADGSNRSTLREAAANAHAVPDVTEATAPSSRSLPSSKTTSAASMARTVSSSASCSSYTALDSLPPVFCSAAISSSTPMLVPPASVCSASPSYAAAPASSAAPSPANGMSLFPFPSSASASLESASGPVPPPTCDVVKNGTCKRNPHLSLTANTEFWDAEDDPTHGVTSVSPVAPSAAAPSFSASRSSSTPSPNEGTLSAGSFFSLPSTSSCPLLPCSPSPSHASSPIAAHSESSNCCSSISLYRSSPSGFPPLRRFLSSNATLSPSFSASHSHSSISSSSSFSCLAPGVPFPASASAGTASTPPSTFTSSPVPSSAAAPAPGSSRACVSSVPGTPSSSVSLMSSVFHSCSSLASPAANIFRMTSNGRSEAMRRWVAAKHDQTEHQLPKEQRKLQQEQLQLQEGHDQLQHLIQRRHQRLGQWQHQMGNLPEELRMPSGGLTPIECWSIGPAAVTGDAGRLSGSARTVNLSKDARARPHGFTSCSNSDSNKRSQGSDTNARDRVASEAAVLLVCSQETFAKEFDSASNPKFLFEFVDQAQQRRVSCAIARAILRIRRQARRKQQQQKQRLQERLNQGLLKRQQEPSTSQQCRLLDPVERQQHLPGGAAEQSGQLSFFQNQQLRNCSRWQHFQRLLGPQHLQTAALAAHPTPSRERNGCERVLPVQGLSPSKREGIPAGLAGSSSSSASSQGDARGDRATVIWRDACAEEGLDLPRLLRESTEADLLTGARSATTGEPTPGSNACVAGGTAVGKSVGAKMNHVVTSRQGRSRIESGRTGPPRRRITSRVTEKQLNVRVSKCSVRQCIRRSTYLHDPTTDVAAANRSRSDESVSRRAHRRLTVGGGVTEEGFSAKVASAAAGKQVGEAGAHPSLSDGDAGSALRCFSRHATAPVRSQRRPVGHDWEFWSRESPKGSSYSELHAGNDLTQIVSELLEILSPSEGTRSIDRTDDHFALGRGFHALKGEDGATKHRCPRKVDPLHVEKRMTGEQLLEGGQGTEMRETKAEQPQFRKVSEQNLLKGRQQRGETNVQEKERYVRLVRALARLRELVSRDHVDQLQQGRRRLSLRTHSLDCCKSDSEIGTLPAGVKGCPRRQHTSFTTLLQDASQASQNYAFNKREPSNDPRLRFSARTSSPRRFVEQMTSSARSDVRDEAKAADEKAEVTGVGEPLLHQTLTFAFAPSREPQRQQVGPLEEMQHEIPARLPAQLLQQSEGITSLRVRQHENGCSSSPDQQRVSAASLLLIEQREQLERLKSVVDFLMRERELQLRLGYHVNEAELQRHWEEEQRRFEEKKRQIPLSAAHLLQGELNAYEWSKNKYLVADDAQKEVATCRENQLRRFSDGREGAVELLHLRGLGLSEAFSEGQSQARPSERRSRPRRERSEQSQVPSRCSSVQKVAVERRDSLSKRETERQDGAPGARDTNTMPFAGAGLLAGSLLESNQVDGNRFAGKNSCAKKGGTNSTATLSPEDRDARVIDSDTQNQKSHRSKHPVTPVEPRIIFRISTPPSCSQESDAEETATERTKSREQSASRFRHQSSY